MDRLTALTRGKQIMLAGSALLLVDTFLRWQEVSASAFGIKISAGQNAWHGFWGIVMCLAVLALLVWLVARIAAVEFSLSVSEPLVAAVLAAIILLFAVIKNLADDYSTTWSYIGVILAAAVAAGAWLEVQAAGGIDALTSDVSAPTSPSAGSATPPPSETPAPPASGEPT